MFPGLVKLTLDVVVDEVVDVFLTGWSNKFSYICYSFSLPGKLTSKI